MSSASTIATFSGLASGIDTAGIIDKMTAYAQKPITQLQQTEQGYNNKLTAWQDLNLKLAALQSATSSLTLAGTYTATSATSSNTAAASVTSLPSAALGDHSLTVNDLAKATKIVSGAQASGSASLGKAGSFTLNGKAVTIAASDSLNDVAVKINQAGAGATASVVNVAPGDFRLVLSGANTGAVNQLSALDSGGTVLNDLGLVNGAGAVGLRQALTIGGSSGAGSLALSNATQSVGATLGITAGSAPAGTVSINGTGISIDLNTDSLSSIADKINGAGISGVSAQVVAAGDGTTRQQLQILGVSSASAFGDSNNVLSTLGVTQQAYGTKVTDAQDAKFNLDGLDMTRATNVVSDALPGATIKLLSGSPAAPASSTLSVTRNTDAIVSSINSFVTAYNATQDYIGSQNLYTAPAADAAAGTAATTPPLFGDTTLNQVQDDLSRAVNVVSGGTTLDSIGITTDTHNHLVVDSAKLTDALQTNPTGVFNLFGLAGVSDNTNVTFAAASAKTQASTGAGFAVDVTQAATQAGLTGSSALTGPLGLPETLTFGGALFPSAASITLAAGSSLTQIVAQINASSTLTGKVSASADQSGHLVLTSQQFGAGNGFSVLSAPQGGGASQLGFSTNSAAPSAATDGLDVQGTINGEAATGKGRTLTGNAGNASTDGLQLLVSATSSGVAGHVQVSHGVADAIGKTITNILDPTNGPLFGAEHSLNAQISDAEDQIQKMQDQVTAYSDYLQQMFSAMEARVSTLQSQGSAFAAQVSGK